MLMLREDSTSVGGRSVDAECHLDTIMIDEGAREKRIRVDSRGHPWKPSVRKAQVQIVTYKDLTTTTTTTTPVRNGEYCTVSSAWTPSLRKSRKSRRLGRTSLFRALSMPQSFTRVCLHHPKCMIALESTSVCDGRSVSASARGKKEPRDED